MASRLAVDDAAERAWEAFLGSLRALETADCPRLGDIADAYRRHAMRTRASRRRFLEAPDGEERLQWLMAVAATVAERMRMCEPVLAELEPSLPTIREVAFRWFAEAGVAPERWREIERRRPEDIVREWIARCDPLPLFIPDALSSVWTADGQVVDEHAYFGAGSTVRPK